MRPHENERIDKDARRLMMECLKKQDMEKFQDLVDEGIITAHQKLTRESTAACFTLGYCDPQYRIKRNTAWAFWPLWEASEFSQHQLDLYLHVAVKGYDNVWHHEGVKEHLRVVKHLAFVGASPDRFYDMSSARGWAVMHCGEYGKLIKAIEAGEAARIEMFRKGIMASLGRSTLPDGNLPRVYSRHV